MRPDTHTPTVGRMKAAIVVAALIGFLLGAAAFMVADYSSPADARHDELVARIDKLEQRISETSRVAERRNDEAVIERLKQIDRRVVELGRKIEDLAKTGPDRTLPRPVPQDNCDSDCIADMLEDLKRTFCEAVGNDCIRSLKGK